MGKTAIHEIALVFHYLSPSLLFPAYYLFFPVPLFPSHLFFPFFYPVKRHPNSSRGLWERSKIPHRGLGRSTDQQRVLFCEFMKSIW